MLREIICQLRNNLGLNEALHFLDAIRVFAVFPMDTPQSFLPQFQK